jgi:hypothetical protein
MEEDNNNEQKIRVKISDIMKKVKTKEDMVNVMREKGKLINNNFRIIFSA